MTPKRIWTARVRGAGLFGKDSVARMLALAPPQPLLLHREPDNVNDRNAVRLTDLYGSDVGYVERGVAAKIAGLLDTGVVLMSIVSAACIPIRGAWKPARTLIWIDDGEADRRSKRRVPIKIDIDDPRILEAKRWARNINWERIK